MATLLFPSASASTGSTVSASSVADPAVYDARTRKCDLGYLREAYAKADGTLGYRCSAEPVSAYVRKGGDASATEGSVCLCNGLMATCGLGQVRSDGRVEPPLLTSGDSLNDVRDLLAGRSSYSAGDVIAYLGADVTPEP